MQTGKKTIKNIHYSMQKQIKNQINYTFMENLILLKAVHKKSYPLIFLCKVPSSVSKKCLYSELNMLMCYSH